jgi:hypothetical protein
MSASAPDPASAGPRPLPVVPAKQRRSGIGLYVFSALMLLIAAALVLAALGKLPLDKLPLDKLPFKLPFKVTR